MRTQADLSATACSLVAREKGILVVESGSSVLAHRLAGLGIVPSPANVVACRELVLTTPGLADGLAGVVVSPAVLDAPDQDCLLDDLRRDGVLIGVAADTGRARASGPPGQGLTEGLDGLGPRLAGLAGRGVGFATWRALFPIGEGLPCWPALRTNAARMARFAELCQRTGLVPVLEVTVPPEGTHGPDLCEAVTSLVLVQVVEQLREHGVAVDATVLAPTSVRPGRHRGQSSGSADATRATAHALRRTLPPELAGVALQTTCSPRLPGGDAGGGDPAGVLAALRRQPLPWPVSFTAGNALIDPLLLAWRGRDDRAEDGQRQLAERLAALTSALRLPRGVARGVPRGVPRRPDTLPVPRRPR